MKSLTIIAGFVLPLIAGLLHHEVRDAISAGRWPTVVGLMLGFNGLFAIVGAILAAFFLAKVRQRAAWVSVGIATLVSGGLSASSGAIKDRVEVISQESDAKKINTWNQQHHGEVLLSLTKSGRPKVKAWRYGGGRSYEITTSGLSFVGSLENKSAEKVVAVVVDLKVMNKEKKQTIVTHRLRLPLEVFPTATVSIDREFAPSAYEDDPAVDELHRAAQQLGDNFAQDYVFIAAIPQSLENIDLRKSLKVEADLTPKE